MTTDALGKLQVLLNDLFQFESRELDFGIYRIMNHKRGEIRRFIAEGLPTAVDEALKGGVAAQQASQAEDLRRKTDRVKETFGEYAIDSKGELNESFRETPLGMEYLEARSRTGSAVDLEELKTTIFNHVFTFFSRYYDNGDFLSKKRYSRRQKYAVPYNGEEVYLHWANADQYYVKTGEHFTDYRYKTNSGITVRFELAAADTEQNNVKGDRRFFVPRTKDAAYDADARALTVPFEYRPLSPKEQTAYGTRNQQEKIIEETAADLPARLEKHPEALAVLEPAGDLARHLRRYTRRNTSDFFVHKDLKGFLNGELDFYLKNEVLDVDDLEAWGPERSDGWFEVMRAVKRVGRDVISFLAQIEDFQKRLFEKKKLVVNAGYCMTLDRVPVELYGEIAASDAQREEWVRLFAIDEIEENITQPGYSEPLTVEFLKSNPYLVLDTMFFGHDFKDRLLASIEDLDGQTNGLLIESENFQALNLLQERYREQIRTVVTDPPYNTGSDGFPYKDGYRHSSWLTMLRSRLVLAWELLSREGALAVTIDDTEQASLSTLVRRVFGEDSFAANVVWEKAYIANQTAAFFSDTHDHVLIHCRDRELFKVGRIERSAEQLQQFKNPDEDPRGPWKAENLSAGKYYSAGQFGIVGPTGKHFLPPPGRYWRCSEAQFNAWREDNRITFGRDGSGRPMLKKYLSEVREGLTPSTWWPYAFAGSNKEASIELKNLGRGFETFSTPKPTKLFKQLIRLLGDQQIYVLDFFAGSGTTGHAVIDLNREDGGDRKYVLVEMGKYFETVLKPRIMKVIYSKDWRDGKPISREGTSHAFKYMKLESYEDALDNVAFTHEREGQEALELYGDEYLLRYMLDFETRGSASLLNVERLAAPFRYTLRLRDGEEKRSVSVDLPETFAYLLGARVRTRKVYHDGERRYLVYRGSTPERGEVVAIWRDVEGWGEEDFEHDRGFVRESALAEGADEVFVNGDSFIPEARPLEGVFKRLMLAGPANGR